MPPVTYSEPKERKPRQTAADKAVDAVRMARAINGKRPFSLASDGYPAPTALEIEEGEAHLMMETTRAKMLADDWLAIHWRLCNEEGWPATTRCAACHTVRFGRPGTIACGHCGSLERWEPDIRRFEAGARRRIEAR